MQKDKILGLMNSTTVDEMPALYIPSYNRFDKECETAKKCLYDFSREALQRCYLTVRESQAEQYLEVNKELIERGCNLLIIPEGEVDGVGPTRNWCLKHAINSGEDIAFILDDDLTGINVLFDGVTKDGEPKSDTLRVADKRAFDGYNQKLVQLIAREARKLFEEHPELIIGAIRKQRFSNNPENAKTRYIINRSGTARQFCIYNTKLVAETNTFVPDDFAKHGDDIGFTANALQKGLSVFRFPWAIYAYTPETESSVLRDIDEEKNHDIHLEEYNNLMKYEVRDYLKITKRYPDIEDDALAYMYGDIDWNKFHKLKGSKSVKVYWE